MVVEAEVGSWVCLVQFRGTRWQAGGGSELSNLVFVSEVFLPPPSCFVEEPL